MIEYRWLRNDEIESWVNPVLEQRNWAKLNINDVMPTCRVLGAFDGIELCGFLCLQLFPVIGPVWSDVDHRDGTITRELADQMHGYMVEAKARGALTLCETPVAERLAQRHGMQKVQEPVYMWVGE
jgi:hypothetical protein